MTAPQEGGSAAPPHARVNVRLRAARGLRMDTRVPGDKSITHRGLLLGLLAEGTTRIRAPLLSDDTRSTLGVVRALGARAEECDGEILVEGTAPGGLREPKDVLDAGNSGTTARLVTGILAAAGVYAVLTGDGSLRQRPMGRVIRPLAAMGARLYARAEDRLLPLTVLPARLRGAEHALEVASAQVKSALLLAGLGAEGVTAVFEPHPSRDHTERMLRAFGAELQTLPRGEGRRVTVAGGQRLRGADVLVPGDISSAAFWLVAGLIVPGAEVVLRDVGVNPTRTGILDALAAMGARVEVEDAHEEAGEPVATLRVQGGQPLTGTVIDGALVPRLIDEIPVLAVAALVATGDTHVRGAAELRVKETDRIAAVASEFGRLGADVEELPDGLVIHGGRPLRGARVHSHGDHRLAMALAVAALVASGETEIVDARCASVSYPGFFPELEAAVAR